MIYTGYAACKWQHGDLLQRAMLLMLSLTGNVGNEGGGIQFGNAPKVARPRRLRLSRTSARRCA